MTAIPLDQPPLPCTTRDGRKDFDLIIETEAKRDLANVRHAVNRCLTRCKGRDGTRNQPAIAPCPIQAECWANAAADGERWVKLLKFVPTRRACWNCGKGVEIGLLQSAKKYCSTDCYNAAKRTARRAA